MTKAHKVTQNSIKNQINNNNKKNKTMIIYNTINNYR